MDKAVIILIGKIRFTQIKTKQQWDNFALYCCTIFIHITPFIKKQCLVTKIVKEYPIPAPYKTPTM
jgi:hypothetical protein